jgi:nitrogenase molybdenum-iron protein alpha/beta subunit
MSRLCVTLPPLAPDYSGAASALFDLGGIVVMHDASGCTGNYTGWDEPRWLGSRSAVFCSGLRRMDAVLGNDEKFVQGTLEAAKSLHPTLIAYLGSPVPMVIGTDLEGMAAETEDASGIPSFGFNTTGQNYYDKGASDVFLRLIRRFAKPGARSSDGKKRANVLGMLPLDVGNLGNCDRILDFISNCGYEINADFAMGLTLEQIEHCADADINFVVSRSGLDAAEYMKKRFDIPFICGVPLGDGRTFRKKLSGNLEAVGRYADGGILIIHEQVMANSLREEILEKADIPVTTGSMFGLDRRIAAEHDLNLPDELSVIKAVNSGRYSVVIADPEIEKILRRPDVKFLKLPHAAVSSKLHWDEYPDYVGDALKLLIADAVSIKSH